MPAIDPNAIRRDGLKAGDPLAVSSATPQLSELISEFTRARDQAGMVTRLQDAEDMRFCRWEGQTADGLKHADERPEGEKVRPWDHSSDTRIPLVDDVCNSIADLCCIGFWNARVRAQPNGATIMTAAQAAEVRTMLSWMIHGPLRDALVDQVELCAQTEGTVGHAILYVGWRRQTALRRRTLKLDALVQQAAQRPPGDILAQLPELIQEADMADSVEQLFSLMFPALSAETHRRMVRELRADGETSFPVPVTVSNAPELLTLRPGQDFFSPPETTELQHARVLFRRLWFTEAQLRELAGQNGWDPLWVKACMPTSGRTEQWTTGFDRTGAWQQQNLIEIVYAYARQVDADGVPGIWCTVFSPNVGTHYAEHYLLDYVHGEYPFIAARLEVTSSRLTDARGVSETFVATAQGEYKNQRDGLYNYAQISLIPPLIEYGTRTGQAPELGPAARLHATMPDQWAWMPTPPGKPEIAFELIKGIKDDVDDYFGRYSETTHPARSQSRQQRLMNRFLSTWSAAFRQALVLCYQYLDPEEVQAILGRPPQLSADMLLQHRVLFWFDVRSLDSDWLLKLVEAINKFVLTSDTAGTIDRAKYVRFILAYFEPTLAEEVTLDQTGASQAMYREVREQCAQMALGNEAIYGENDPAAGQKLQFLQQIIQSNPVYAGQLSANARFRELVQKYQQSLQQSVVQEQNKIVGRIGVQPETMTQSQ